MLGWTSPYVIIGSWQHGISPFPLFGILTLDQGLCQDEQDLMSRFIIKIQTPSVCRSWTKNLHMWRQFEE